MKALFLIIGVVASFSASADFFSDLAKTSDGKVAALRKDYYSAIQDGRRPSIESIRDVGILDEVSKITDYPAGWVSRSYYKLILPYFWYRGQKNWDSEFVWTQEMVNLVNVQRGLCKDAQMDSLKTKSELAAAVKTAPVGQYGQQTMSLYMVKKYEASLKVISLTCRGVHPGNSAVGNQVYLDMQARVKVEKGGF